MRQFHDNMLKISRLKTTSGNIRNYVATATAEADIQPLGRDRGQVDVGVFGKTYIAYIESNITVQKGDRCQDRNGVVYMVSEVTTREFGAYPYQELLLNKAS
jgi:hypothetical protein